MDDEQQGRAACPKSRLDAAAACRPPLPPTSPAHRPGLPTSGSPARWSCPVAWWRRGPAWRSRWAEPSWGEAPALSTGQPATQMCGVRFQGNALRRIGRVERSRWAGEPMQATVDGSGQARQAFMSPVALALGSLHLHCSLHHLDGTRAPRDTPQPTCVRLPSASQPLASLPPLNWDLLAHWRSAGAPVQPGRAPRRRASRWPSRRASRRSWRTSSGCARSAA